MGLKPLKRASKANTQGLSEGQRKRRNTFQHQEDQKEQFTSKNQLGDKLAPILIVVGLCIVTATTYPACILSLKYEGPLLAFGILVFMAGTTLIACERNLQGTYITYMWIAAFIVIGSITGVSVIGTLIKP